MEYKQIQELIKVINKSNISELSIEEGDFKITIKQSQTTEAHYIMPQQAPQLMAPAAPQTIAPAAPQAVSSPAAPSAAPAAAANDKQTIIKSPMIGTFYRSPTPEKPLFVNVGDEINVGSVLCIIEAMKLFNEIESEVKGRIVKVLVDDASPVEYDQPLFIVETA